MEPRHLGAIAVIVKSFVAMHHKEIDYRSEIEVLKLQAKTKKGAGFAKKKKLEKEKVNSI